MVSYSGYWTYKDLIQTYELPSKRQTLLSEPSYPESSVMGFLLQPEYSIFKYIAEVAQMDIRMGQSLFTSTLFVCDDETLKEQYGEDFFMKLDRNAALSIINYNIIPRIMTLSTLQTLKMAKLDTRNKKNQINFLNKDGTLFLDGHIVMLGEVGRSNGIIQKVSGLLIPVDFEM
jgi:hypothetical protein